MKQQVSPGIIAVAIVVVLGVIGAIGYLTIGKKQDAKAGLNTSNPNYEKYMSGAGSGGGMGSGSAGSPSHGSPSSSGSPGSSGSPNH